MRRMKIFEATMEIVRRTNYAQCYSFKYSMRPGTPGAEMENQVDEAVKDARLARLQALLRQQQTAFNEACVGKTIDVLLEKPGRDANQLIGRSPWLQSVVVPSHCGHIGDIVSVEITHSLTNSLSAQPAGACN